jgi:hypothetical protein
LESTPATHLEVDQGGYLLKFLTLFLGDAIVGMVVDETNVYEGDPK